MTIAQILDREATTLFLENLVEHALRVGKFGQSREKAGVEIDADAMGAIGFIREAMRREAIHALSLPGVSNLDRVYNEAYFESLGASDDGRWPLDLDRVARESFARENFAGPHQGEQRRAAAAGLLAAAVALKQRCELFVRDTLHPEE